MEYIDATLLTDLLTVGTVGFIGGILFPWAFRLIAYLVEIVRVVLE